MQEKAKKIKDSISSYNLNSIEENEVEIKRTNNPLLIAKIDNMFEAEFLLNLCKQEKTDNLDIEFCIKYDKSLKPLGFIPLTFNSIQMIHEYDNRIKLGLYVNDTFQLLTTSQEICLK